MMRLVFFGTFNLLQIALLKFWLSLKVYIHSAIFPTELLNKSDDLWETTSTNYIGLFRISNKSKAKYVLKREREEKNHQEHLHQQGFFLFKNSKLDVRKNNTL